MGAFVGHGIIKNSSFWVRSFIGSIRLVLFKTTITQKNNDQLH